MPNTPTLHADAIKFGGKILYKDDKITVVPCVLMAEGVQNGALKPFEEFYDPNGLEGALWFEGVPIVREHPPSYVTHLTPKIGRIRNVQPDVEGRRIIAEAVLFNDRLTPAEMKAIDDGEMLGGSIGFWCNDEPCAETQIWTDGTEYTCIQKKPFFGDHFALVADPACPVGVCGLNVETQVQPHDDCKCQKKKLEVTNLPDEPKGAADTQPVIEGQKPPAGDPKPPEGDAQAAKNPEPKTNAMDMGVLVVKAKTILEMADDYAKRGEALALLMEIVTEGGSSAVVAANSKPQDEIVVEMDSVLKERFEKLEAKFDSQATEIKDLKIEKQNRETALKVEQDEKTKTALKANFDQAYQMEFEKYWPIIQKDGINTFLADPEHAKHWDVKGNRKAIMPVGAAFVQHDSDGEEAEMDSMGVPSEEDLHKKLGGKRA